MKIPYLAPAAALALAPALALSLTLLSSPALAAPPEIRPLLVSETDLRFHAADRVEGEDGFAATRLRLGVSAELTSWFRAVGQAEWARDRPSLIDAFGVIGPFKSCELRIGAARTPLFASAHDDEVFILPVPELSMVTRAFWPGRDLGAEVHRIATPQLPLEAWLRAGNGSGALLGNDNSDFSMDARLDVALGRALPGADAALPFGLRLGGGIHLDSVEDRPAVKGETADGFTFYRSATVTGPRRVVEAHAVVFAGPVKVTAEVALAHESRSRDTDGNPRTPRLPLPEVRSAGGYVEAAWMITGQHRTTAAWPVNAPWNVWTWGALEVAGRAERLDLGRGARDVEAGGATSASAAVRWWATSFAALSAAIYYYDYDKPPVEEPQRSDSWLALVRLTARVPSKHLE